MEEFKNDFIPGAIILLIVMVIFALSVKYCIRKEVQNKKCIVELTGGEIIEECGSCDIEGDFVNGYSSKEVRHYKTIKLDKPCE